jgi:class 3 adenylate cyclase
MPEDSAGTRAAETRRLAAIMFTDMVGFSRQMGSDEARMLRVLTVHNQLIEQAVAEHQVVYLQRADNGDKPVRRYSHIVNKITPVSSISHGRPGRVCFLIYGRTGLPSYDSPHA